MKTLLKEDWTQIPEDGKCSLLQYSDALCVYS